MGDNRIHSWKTLLVFLALTIPSVALAQNEIVLENQLPGNPPSEWEVIGAGDQDIQGFPTEISVDQGETVYFKIKTAASDYKIDIYRLGYYGGDGARLVATIQPSATLPQIQPTCDFVDATNLVDCGNWQISASWDVPVNAVSGLYIAKPVHEVPNDGSTSHIPFIVRDDDGNSDLLFQTSDTTWHAYNLWAESGPTAGYSTYDGPDGKADKVSYNRPLGTRESPTENSPFNAEYAMIRWIERNGYDVSYFTNIDTDFRGAEILDHNIFLSVGHDEYWSKAMRDNVTAARDAGVNLAFFSGNEIYWKIRWEDSTQAPAGGGPFKTLVCYKEGDLGENQCFAKCDPDPNVWTGLWRSGCAYTPPADGCLPENALTGQISWVETTDVMTVPGTYGQLPFWRNTSIASMLPTESTDLPHGTIGYECDFEQYLSDYPDRRLKMSETDLVNGEVHHLSLYKADSGALVFGAGTVQWSWGLDDYHDRPGGAESPSMQQATVNLFADMGSLPGTLQAGLTPAAPNYDTGVPTSAITYPTGGETVHTGIPVIVQGTAADTGGSGVAFVEVSTDGGATWLPASGLETWTYSWTPLVDGVATIQSRVTDAYFNMETPGPGVQVGVIMTNCPCSVFNGTVPTVASHTDAQSVNLGMKFRSDDDGIITAVRFYKGPLNTGTHTGHLWTYPGGALLGSVTFTGETATGWQEQAFVTPIPVDANTTYVVSYYAPNGGYARDVDFFDLSGVDNPPLHAPAEGAEGPNGVYVYDVVGAYPSNPAGGTNYWVDVKFDPVVDIIPPVVTQKTPAPSSVDVLIETNVTATFDEDVDPLTVNLVLQDPLLAIVPATVTYDAPSRTVTLDPTADLDYGTVYTATLDPASDPDGNTMPAAEVWSFTTEIQDIIPPVISGLTATPNIDGTVTITWTTDEPAHSQVDFGLVPGVLGSQESDPTLVTSHSLVLTGLAFETTYYYRATSTDEATNSSTEPIAINPPAEFTTPVEPVPPCLLVTTATEFETGTDDGGIFISPKEGGELTLAPVEGSTFSGASLPAGWETGPWVGGTATVTGGNLVVASAYARTTTFYTPGHVIEFVATFNAAANQHVGFGDDLNAIPARAIFSTGGSTTNLFATTNPGGEAFDLGPGLIGAPHLFRIEWTATTVSFFIDGAPVHTKTIAITDNMRPIASDYYNDSIDLTVDWLRMTPYVASGSYESAVYNPGAPTDWFEMAWTSDLPAGTSVGVYVRTGNVPVPDGTWSPYTLVPSSGSYIGVNSTYLQYRVDLATSDPAVTPTVKDISIWCEMGEDTTPPVISNLTAVSGPAGTTATVTWNTSEVATSRVDYGTSPGLLDLNESNPALVLSHSISLTGLTPGETYHYQATSEDGSANSTTEPPVTPAQFTTTVPPCEVVTTVADFGLGTLTGTRVDQMGDGGLALAATTNEPFDGTTLPAGWSQSSWPSGGSAVVGGGVLTVNGAFAATDAFFAAGQVLEFVATFTAGNYQHVGFGVDVNTDQNWAMFSTVNTSPVLNARTGNGTNDEIFSLGTGYLDAPHLYRIEWTATGVSYYVDGSLVHTAAAPNLPTGTLRPLVSDYFNDGLAVTLDSLWMTPYTTPGTWESPIYDAGQDFSTWHHIFWNADEPVGTTLGLSVRGGDTPTPDGSWTAYAPVAGSGTDLALDARYLQVEVQMSTGDTGVTPVLHDIAISCACCAAAPNVIAMDASAVVALTSLNPCAAAVPVKITRVNSTPVRSYSVTFGLSGELALCVDAATSILESTFLNGFGTGTTFQVTDHLDGTYTVAGAIVGEPCGSVVLEDTLFTVDLTHAVPEGLGTVTILAMDLQDCSSSPLAVSAGDPADITIDTVIPLPVTSLTAVHKPSGNGPGNTLAIDLAWTESTSPDAGLVSVYRKEFGGYPEYDQGGGTEPTLSPTATPADAEAAGWTLVGVVPASPTADLMGVRDTWSFVAFCTDTLGNPSIPSNLTVGLPNYIVGDVSDGVVPGGETLPGDGDNQVNTLDMSLLGSYYGNPIIQDHEANRLDIGPLAGDPLLGRPVTDDLIEFEDLILFGVNFGTSGLLAKKDPLVFKVPVPAAENRLDVEIGPLAGPGENFQVQLVMQGDGRIQALSVPLTWDPEVAEPLTVQRGALLTAQGGTSLVLSPVPGTVDIGLMGRRAQGISGQGVVATVAFRLLTDGDPDIGIGEIRSRNSNNEELGLTGVVLEDTDVPSVVPSITRLHPPAPNPFNPMTTLAYDIASAGRVTLKIYSFDGRLVRTLVDENAAAGRYEVVWQGRDQGGRQVASGAYVIRMTTPNKTETKRMMLLK